MNGGIVLYTLMEIVVLVALLPLHRLLRDDFPLQAMVEKGTMDQVRLAYERQRAQAQLEHLKATAEEGKTKQTW